MPTPPYGLPEPPPMLNVVVNPDEKPVPPPLSIRLGIDLVARFRLARDLIEADARRQLDQRHAASVPVDAEHPEIGDHEIDDVGAGQGKRAAMQELGLVLGRMLHDYHDLLDPG